MPCITSDIDELDLACILTGSGKLFSFIKCTVIGGAKSGYELVYLQATQVIISHLKCQVYDELCTIVVSSRNKETGDIVL